MAIGMSLAEFWDGSPQLVRYYREAHRLKMEEENQKAWVQGLYIKSALDSSLSQLFKKKGSKGVQYLEKPLEILEKSEKERKRDAVRERRRAVRAFEALRQEQIRRKRKERNAWSGKSVEKGRAPGSATG